MKGFFSFVRDAVIGRARSFPLIGFSISFWRTGYKMPPKPNFFKPEEIEGLDQELVAKLDWARGRAGVPFFITSGKRSEDHNETVGGVKDSAHTRGLAVDLRCADGNTRFRMVQALLLAGFQRMGIYDKHIHVDTDKTLAPEVIWVGVSH